MLGNIIARLHDDAFTEEFVARLDDLVLLARLQQAADAAGISLGEAASECVGRFMQHASDEQWLALMTAANQAPDAGEACLRRMLLMALEGESVLSLPRHAHEHEAH